MKQSLKRLVIDTATDHIFMALAKDKEVIQSVYQKGNHDHSVTMMPLLEGMLKISDLELKDIDQVIVGIGPGSYTGVRIGVTVAKMIAYLNDLPIYTVSSLALMATHAEDGLVCPMIDARRGNAFMGLYAHEDGQLIQVKSDVLDNIRRYQDNIKEDFQVVEKGQPKLHKIFDSALLTKIDDIHELVPNYLQKTEAERQLNAND